MISSLTLFFTLFHGHSEHSNLWAIEVTPPSAHHFNLEAPHSAVAGAVKFVVAEASAQKMIFQSENSSLAAGGVNVEVSAFICDEKKTYCVKKKLSVLLDAKNAHEIEEPFEEPAEMAKLKKLLKEKKIKEPFINNFVDLAITSAKKYKKLLLIDFYGIWCPPCNLYNETIFSTPEFYEKTKNYVLLKLDADHENSFKLKSQFKVGGYPTLIVAKVNDAGELNEVGRVVGYFPSKEFYSRLDTIYAHRDDSEEQRWKGRLEELLSVKLEQKNYDEMIKLSEKASEARVLIYRYIAELEKNSDYLKLEKNILEVKKTLDSIANETQKTGSDTLMHAIDFLNTEFWLKQEKYKKLADHLINELEKRVDPHTFFVKGSELTIADLDTMRMDLAKTLNDQKLEEKIRKSAIKNYEKLMAYYQKQGKTDLRSLNLEYAYLLSKDGRTNEAKKLYDRFIKKYPIEFTFYFAASKMYYTLKEYTKARALAEKAFEFSYGDNRVRSMERLVSIMAEQGQKKEALARGNEFLKVFSSPIVADTRTGKYIDHLKTVMKELEEGKK